MEKTRESLTTNTAKEMMPKIDKSGRFCSPRAARELALYVFLVSLLAFVFSLIIGNFCMYLNLMYDLVRESSFFFFIVGKKKRILCVLAN